MSFVYLLECEGAFKIGKANNVKRRLYSLQSGNPKEIKLLHTISTDRPLDLERDFHHFFQEKRIGGEWFDLTPEDVDVFLEYENLPFHLAENRRLWGLVEQRDRDAAELRAALREALKMAPKQLTAGEPLTGGQGVTVAPSNQLETARVEQDGPQTTTPDTGARQVTGTRISPTGADGSMSYADIANWLEENIGGGSP